VRRALTEIRWSQPLHKHRRAAERGARVPRTWSLGCRGNVVTGGSLDGERPLSRLTGRAASGLPTLSVLPLAGRPNLDWPRPSWYTVAGNWSCVAERLRGFQGWNQ